MTAELVEMARKKARSITCHSKVVAIGFDRRGRLLGCSTNYPRFSKYGGGVHAEMHLLKKHGPKVNKIILCRFGNAGDLLPIDVCPACRKVLNNKGIKVFKIIA